MCPKIRQQYPKDNQRKTPKDVKELIKPLRLENKNHHQVAKMAVFGTVTTITSKVCSRTILKRVTIKEERPPTKGTS
ncbi:hypothetical protein ACJMK2_008119, partial [Sinanodonta woodiana]